VLLLLQAEASFWTAEEVDLSQDQQDWDSLNNQERHFIRYVCILAYTTSSITLLHRASISGALLIPCSL
jgi:ribonucleotide reductase beta subunit family protein with ferritin-like domain